jgi:small nuclear ribonucleoprotein (snRNP)-like protein
MKQRWVVLSFLVSTAIILLAGCTPPPAPTAVAFTTPYQAVLLSNNSVYFGKLAGFGTPNPVLTDVFYIVTQTDPTTKQSKNILVKRGKELHGPDRMYLNASSIVFVEPVGADSKVAQLISEAGKQ